MRIRSSVLLSVGLLFLTQRPLAGQTSLLVTYANQGIQQITFRSTVLEDTTQFPADAFHIWHMKMTDLKGNPATCSQCTWGETNNGKAWNPVTHTWTYNYVWGSISVGFEQAGDTLNMNVTETNLANSGYILDGATIYPLVLNFPQLPAHFTDASYPQYAYETTGPGVTTADWGSGEVVSVVPDASKPLYSGFLPTGTAAAYTAIISGTAPDGLAVFLPHNDRPVQPGQSDSFTVSLRFASSGTPTGTVASDAYQNWASTWPSQLSWSDRRVIGTAYLASSPNGDPSKPAGFLNNPRRYFDDSNSDDFDVTYSAGLQKFQNRVLAQAASIVTNLAALNAQGVVTWDIEGEQYPQETSYVCSPDQIAQVAPEMESTVTDKSSAFYGMKLDDAYFKTISNAGYRVGVCIRPQQFTLKGDGTAQQVYLPDSAIAAQLIRKIQYAHSRWGATLFYVDTTVESNGAVLDAGIFQQVAAAFPDSLIMPEESTPKYYAYTAPFQTFLFHGDLGTDQSVYNYYPHAFSTNLVNDVSASSLAAALTPLTASVSRGDILMGHADYAQANNPTIVQIYQAAGRSSSTSTPSSPSAPASSPVSILAPIDSSTVSGTITVTAQISVNLNAAGSYLLVDGAEYGSYKALQPPYQYPLDTTLFPNGQHTVQVWAQDTVSTTDLSQVVTISVANVPAVSTPPPIPSSTSATGTSGFTGTSTDSSNGLVSITSPSSGATLSGTVLVTAQVNTGIDSAGSYLMVDGIQFGQKRVTSSPYVYLFDTTLLSDGMHSLQIWAHDSSNAVDLSAVLPIVIANGSANTTPATGATGSTTNPGSTSTTDSATTQSEGANETASTYPITINYPSNGQSVSGTLVVSSLITQALDAAGSHLIVDGTPALSTQVSSAPYLYSVDMSSLTPGTHILQVWAHDINNDTLLSNPVTVTAVR